MLLLEKNIIHKYWRFCYRFIAFKFALCGLLSFDVIRKQWLKQCNYSVVQSALMTGFRTDFTSSVWNFCRWVADVPPRETSPAAKSEEKRLFSQATIAHAFKVFVWRNDSLLTLLAERKFMKRWRSGRLDPYTQDNVSTYKRGLK